MKANNKDLLETSPGVHTNLTLGETRNLAAIPMGDNVDASVQLVWTGTPAGNFKLQVSNDPVNTTPANWTDVANTETTVSAAGSLVFEFPDCTVEHLRVVYTATGAGTAPVLTVARAKTKGR